MTPPLLVSNFKRKQKCQIPGPWPRKHTKTTGDLLESCLQVHATAVSHVPHTSCSESATPSLNLHLAAAAPVTLLFLLEHGLTSHWNLPVPGRVASSAPCTATCRSLAFPVQSQASFRAIHPFGWLLVGKRNAGICSHGDRAEAPCHLHQSHAERRIAFRRFTAASTAFSSVGLWPLYA